MAQWFVLGTGNFALEIHQWACDAGNKISDFGGFLGDASGAAPQRTGLPTLDELAVSFGDGAIVFNAINAPEIKRKVCSRLAERGARFETLIHPSAVVRAGSIGAGSVICPLCIVGPQVELGRWVTLNYHSGIGHETQVGDFVSTAPGVQIGGNSSLGEGVYVGMNATIIDRVKVGSNAFVNAGSVVIGRVRDSSRVSGNPARRTQAF